MGGWVDGVRLSPTGLFRNMGGAVRVCCVGVVCDGADVDLWRWWLGGGKGTLAQQIQHVVSASNARPAKEEVGCTWCGGGGTESDEAVLQPAFLPVSLFHVIMRQQRRCIMLWPDEYVYPAAGELAHEASSEVETTRYSRSAVVRCARPEDGHLKLCAFE